MTALSQVDIRAIKEQHPHGEKIERLLQQPERLIASLLIGNNVANISLSAIVAYMTSLYLGGFFIALSTFFLTLFIIIFCEIAPKQIALIFKRQIAIAVVWPVSFFYIMFTPLLSLTLQLTRLFFPILRRVPNGENLEESLEHMVDLAHTSGYINQYERDFIGNVLDLNDKTARQIMTHRKDVFSLDSGARITDSYAAMAEYSYSRIPVYRDNPENIIGLLYMSDVQKFCMYHTSPFTRHDKHLDSNKKQNDWPQDFETTTVLQLMKPVAFLPDSMRVSDLFFYFKNNDNNMVIVFDEYGGLTGVVSQEDVLETVFGKLYDEDEQDEAAILVIQQEADTFVFPGTLGIQQFEEFFHIELQEEENSPRLATMSGYICNELGYIPEQNETIRRPEGNYHVVESDGKRIVRLRFQPNGVDEREKKPEDSTPQTI